MQLLEQHRSMECMVELLAVYEEEDQAYGNLLEGCTQLYQYLLQPFRDMRELSCLYKMEILVNKAHTNTHTHAHAHWDTQ